MKKISPFSSLFLIVVFTIFSVIGCGGGGGGGDSTPPIPLKTSNIRQFEPSDSWNYSASGTLSDGVTTVNITGTANSQVLSTLKQSPVTQDDCLDQFTVITLSGQGQSITFDSHDYFLQDSNGSIFIYGEGDIVSGDIWVIFPAEGYYLSLESPMAVGQSHGSMVDFDDGSSLTYSYSVDSIQNVSTPLGSYESYKITSNLSVVYGTGDSEVVNATSWYVPGLGTVKLSETDSYYSGGFLQFALQFTATIDSTSIVY
jgi:hypothetical protein